MPAIAGRCTEAMGKATRMGAGPRFLPRSEGPGPPLCLAVNFYPRRDIRVAVNYNLGIRFRENEAC